MANVRAGLKRRISTPTLFRRTTAKEAEELVEEIVEERTSRARSTSTSIAYPTISSTESPTSAPAPDHQAVLPTPHHSWADLHVSPPIPEEGLSAPPTSLLSSIYNLGESSVLRLTTWARPRRHGHAAVRRGSDDSEKGLDVGPGQGRSDWWGKAGRDTDSGYFSLPPTPPEEKPETMAYDFATALKGVPSLPTPALSSRSLSKPRSRDSHRHQHKGAREGWLRTVYNVWAGCGGSSGKTGEVMRELGWTVGLLVGMFFVTGAMALWTISGLPM